MNKKPDVRFADVGDTNKTTAVIVNDVLVGHIQMDRDGYYYFWTNGFTAFSTPMLMAILERLDDLNVKWDEEIERRFNPAL